MWLRADSGVQRNRSNVVSWADRSAHGFTFIAPTNTSLRPTWVSDSTPGVAAVRFAASANQTVAGDLGRTLTQATIFTLGRFLDTAGGARFVCAFGTRNLSGLQMTLDRQSADGVYHFDGAAGRLADNAIAGTKFRVFTQTYGEDAPDRHHLLVDGKTVLDTRTTTGRAYSAIATNVVVGRYPGLGGFGGDLVEWIVYDRVLSAEERFEVEEYLRQRAGLAPFVPAESIDLAGSKTLSHDPSNPPAWILDSGNRTLTAGNSPAPSFAVSAFPVTHQVIQTRITPGTGDGSVGLTFAYVNDGMFHLFEWARTNSVDSVWGAMTQGMKWRSFRIPSGETPAPGDFAPGADPARATLLQTNIIPWVAGRTYDVTVDLGTDATTLVINFGTTNLVTWNGPGGLPAGRFGYFSRNVGGSVFGPLVLPDGQLVLTSLEPGQDDQWTLRWAGGSGPYSIEVASENSEWRWEQLGPATLNQSKTFRSPGRAVVLRVRSGE